MGVQRDRLAGAADLAERGGGRLDAHADAADRDDDAGAVARFDRAADERDHALWSLARAARSVGDALGELAAARASISRPWRAWRWQMAIAAASAASSGW